MKKYLLTAVLFCAPFCFVCAQGGKQNIHFTIKKDASQSNKINIYAKNTGTAAISGVLGASNLTLCVAVASSVSPQPAPQISTPIAGQSFTSIEDHGGGTGLNVYTWNGLGTTASVNFPVGTEVLIASVVFTASSGTASVDLAMLPAGGPSLFDYCYIAPGGTDQTDYSKPFYSDVANDPNLHNNGGANNYNTNGLSTLGLAGVALSSITPVTYGDENYPVLKSTTTFHVSVSPNSVNSSATLLINMPSTGKAEIRVFDASGRLVYSYTANFSTGTNYHTLNTGAYSKGSYFVNVVTGSGDKQTIQIIKASQP